MRTHGLKVLGLALVAALGLMALTASSAFAVEALKLGDQFYSNNEAAGKFLINTGTASPAGLTTQAIAGKQIGAGRLLIPSKAAELVCKAGEINSATIANEYENFLTKTMAAGGHGSGTIVFKECTVEQIKEDELTGVKLTNCVPNFATTPGTITANVLLLAKKHEGVTYLLFVPKVTSEATAKANEALTSTFTNIKFNEETCSLPPALSVTGSFVTKAPTADAVKPILKTKSWELVAGVVKPSAEQVLLGAKLKFGANEAFLDKEDEAELVGKAVPWGAM
jgi:hypothetical protein